tara:strand:+ start:930 stop:2333 length:1404 start_codon:yes stop_codon:yes gene_type:complete
MRFLILIFVLFLGCEDDPVSIQCDEGFENIDGECAIVCTDGFVETDGFCVLDCPTVECDDGYVKLFCDCYSIEETTEIILYTDDFEFPPNGGGFIDPNRPESIYWHSYYTVGELSSNIGQLINLEELVLRGIRLAGEIPPEIGNLVNLDRLELSNNYIFGEIPSEISKLVNLRHLDLSTNGLSGNIPDIFEDLTNLWSIDLGTNNLSGLLPSSLWTLNEELFTLTLSNNQFNIPFPSGIINLTNLQHFRMADNALYGQIPHEICDMQFRWEDNANWANWFNIYNNYLCETFENIDGYMEPVIEYPECITQSQNCSSDLSGCIDENACNYDETSTIEDGSCEYNDYGCNFCLTSNSSECSDCFVGQWECIGNSTIYDNVDCEYNENEIFEFDITNQRYVFTNTEATLSYTDSDDTVSFDISCSTNGMRFLSNQDDVTFAYNIESDIITFYKISSENSICETWQMQKIQ